MHAFWDLGEGEAALLLDQAGLRNPSDLARPLPAIEPQNAFQRQAERDHLDVVARPDAARLGSDRLPSLDPIEDRGYVPIIGEIVERSLGWAFDQNIDGELESGHD